MKVRGGLRRPHARPAPPDAWPRSAACLARLTALTLGALSLLGAGCRDDEAEQLRTLRPAKSLSTHASALELSPPPASPVRAEHGRWLVQLPSAGATTRARLPGGCEVTLGDDADTVHIPALFDGLPEVLQTAPGEPLRLRPRPGCDEARAAPLLWKQISGPPVALRPSERGWVLELQMPSLEDLLPGPLPPGPVPISPRLQGAVELEANLQLDANALRRRVRLVPLARWGGLPNVATGQRLLLAGSGWQQRKGPPADLRDHGRASSVLLQARGVHLFQAAGGQQIELTAGRYDETRLDCGRGGCHEAESRAARESPMTSALSRAGDAPCAAACHTTGQPGCDDGGFDLLRRSLRPTGFDGRALDVSRSPALQRLAAVGCLACHGPTAIPAPEGRARIVESAVCASCHDAPPRYTRVVQWQRSGMAKARHGATLASAPRCRGCHTSLGALGMDAAATDTGLSCAVCHDPHGDSSHALLRERPVPGALRPYFAGTPSAVCVECHAGRTETGWPVSSAAWISAGVGAVDPRDGTPWRHGQGAQGAGCLNCHGRQVAPADEGAGPDHSFLAPPVPGAHPAGPPNTTAHHGQWPEGAPDLGSVAGRARWNLALLAADAAAHHHNPVWSRSLRTLSERALGLQTDTTTTATGAGQ